MKTSLLALALALPCALLAHTVAVVDMERVLANHPNTPNDQKTLEATLADYSKERDALRVDLERLADERDQTLKDAQNPMLAPAKAEELRQKAAQQERALQEAAQRAEAQMAERSRTLTEMERRFIKRTTDEIQAHIKAEAEKKGSTLSSTRTPSPTSSPTATSPTASSSSAAASPPSRTPPRTALSSPRPPRPASPPPSDRKDSHEPRTRRGPHPQP